MKVKNSILDRVRERNRAARRLNETDRLARDLRLSPEEVAFWTAIVQGTTNIVRPGKSPCDYSPWQEALYELSRDPPFIGPSPDGPFSLLSRLMDFAADAAQPGWPEPRQDLIEFALVFLEADVMLFRSGYVKRHLLRRLQQSELTTSQTDRVIALLRRTIRRGASVEEFRAYKKLAGHLFRHDDTVGFVDWLEGLANGAIITMDRADPTVFVRLFHSPTLTEADREKLFTVAWFGRSPWGVMYPKFDQVVQAGKRLREPSQLVAYSAFNMLEAIRRRRRRNERVDFLLSSKA